MDFRCQRRLLPYFAASFKQGQVLVFNISVSYNLVISKLHLLRVYFAGQVMDLFLVVVYQIVLYFATCVGEGSQ